MTLGLAALVRLAPVLGSDFPLGDGGMFLAAIRDIRAAGGALPAITSYNGGLPFAYPPLGFYLAAAITLAGVPATEVLRVLPAVLSVLSVVAFAALARRFFAGEEEARWATLCFALVPSAWEWTVMGGGLTRSLGLVAALSALAALLALWRAPGVPRALTAGALAGATVLAHPSAPVWLCAAALVLAPARLRSWRAARHTALAFAVACAIALPWLGLMLARHSWAAMTAPSVIVTSSVFGVLKEVALWHVSTEGGVQVWRWASLAGVVVAVRGRRFDLLALLLVSRLLDPRSLQPWNALPVALLAGLGCAALLALVRSWQPRRSTAALLAVLVGTAGTVDAAFHRSDVMTPISGEDQVAMTWMAAALPAGTMVAVVEPPYYNASEWLPALPLRSIATYQGFEWVPGRLTPQIRRRFALLHAALGGADTLDGWVVAQGVDTVYLTAAWTEARGVALLAALRDQGAYRVLYSDGKAAVFRREPPD